MSAASDRAAAIEARAATLDGAHAPPANAGPIATDDEVAAAVAAAQFGRFRGAWQPSTAYKASDVVSYAGAMWASKADFTSGVSFNAANWNSAVPAPGEELNVNIVTANPNPLFTGTGDTAFRDLAGWTLPALAAQDRPVLLRLYLPLLQIAAANYNINFQIVDQATAVGTAASASNCFLDRLIFFGTAFAEGPVIWERRLPAGTALPALKVRYKGSGNTNNAATLNQSGAWDPVYGRLEHVLR